MRIPSFGNTNPKVPNIPMPPRGVNGNLPPSLTPTTPVTVGGTKYTVVGSSKGVTTYQLKNTNFKSKNNALSMKKGEGGNVTELEYTMTNGDQITFKYEGAKGSETPTLVTRKKKATGDTEADLETWDIKNDTYQKGKEITQVRDPEGGELGGFDAKTPLNKVPVKDRVKHIVKNAPSNLNPKKLTNWLMSKEGLWAMKTAATLGLGAAAIYFLFSFFGGVAAAIGETISAAVDAAKAALDGTFNNIASAICESEGKCKHCPGIDQEEPDSSDEVERAQATYGVAIPPDTGTVDTETGETGETGGESGGDNEEKDSTSECCSRDHPCVAEKRQALWDVFNSALILIVILAALGFLGVGPFKSWTGGGDGAASGGAEGAGGSGVTIVSAPAPAPATAPAPASTSSLSSDIAEAKVAAAEAKASAADSAASAAEAAEKVKPTESS